MNNQQNILKKIILANYSPHARASYDILVSIRMFATIVCEKLGYLDMLVETPYGKQPNDETYKFIDCIFEARLSNGNNLCVYAKQSKSLKNIDCYLNNIQSEVRKIMLTDILETL